ncbi:unnamed protein product [Allacma fusca]|uniref:Uncharacterized protein n=1 Tax=Allacma fusca TaxID=39272 RepID=A0A8J2JQD5_9HEXA|nr:unnamed protein product [Allacma fusca]
MDYDKKRKRRATKQCSDYQPSRKSPKVTGKSLKVAAHSSRYSENSSTDGETVTVPAWNPKISSGNALCCSDNQATNQEIASKPVYESQDNSYSELELVSEKLSSGASSSHKTSRESLCMHVQMHSRSSVNNYFGGKKSNDALIDTAIKEWLKQASNRIYLKQSRAEKFSSVYQDRWGQ